MGVFDMLCKNYSLTQVHEAYIQAVHAKSINNGGYSMSMDDFLEIRDILNISRKHASSTHELHSIDP